MDKLDISTIDLGRRQALKTGGGLGVLGVFAALGMLPPAASAAVERKVFEAKSLAEAFKAMGVSPAESSQIILDVPETAENGATVPVVIESRLPHTQQIAILVDKNPTALSFNMVFPEGTEGYLSTRIKMAQTSSVIALVKADGKFYKVGKEVKVTAGGC
jgi:sulfur-oxidizing protein SoxY